MASHAAAISSSSEDDDFLPPPGTPNRKKRKGKAKYRKEWEKDFKWIDSVREDEFKANCTVCRRQFSVSHGGLTDVKQHASGEAHKKNETQRRSQGALTQFLVRQATPEANMVCQITKHVYCMLVVA